jgi:hypothetical protein
MPSDQEKGRVQHPAQHVFNYRRKRISWRRRLWLLLHGILSRKGRPEGYLGVIKSLCKGLLQSTQRSYQMVRK